MTNPTESALQARNSQLIEALDRAARETLRLAGEVMKRDGEIEKLIVERDRAREQLARIRTMLRNVEIGDFK